MFLSWHIWREIASPNIRNGHQREFYIFGSSTVVRFSLCVDHGKLI